MADIKYDYGIPTDETHNGVTIYEGNSDEVLSAAYYEGRQARCDKLDSGSNPYTSAQRQCREDWYIGFHDVGGGVSVEDRVRAERNGRNV